MRILFATTTLPHSRRNGGEIASMNFLETLERLGHEVHVVGYTRLGDVQLDGPRIYSAGPWPIETANAGLVRHLWLLRALATGQAITNTKFISRAYRRALATAAHHAADLLIIDHAHLGWISETAELPARRVYIAHNAEADLYSKAVGKAGLAMRLVYSREARKLAIVEAALVRGSWQTWCLSEGDRDILLKLAGGSPVIKVMALPGQAFDTSKPVEKSRDIGMIGSWNWNINRQGAEWFIAHVLPYLPTELSVHIAGGGSQTLECVDARVRLEGRVPDAGAFMRSCRVLVVPTLIGSGIQLKTIEGLSLGVPMVATAVALRGIADVPAHVSVANDPQHFAAAIASKLVEPDESPREAIRGRMWAAGLRATLSAQIAAALAELGA